MVLEKTHDVVQLRPESTERRLIWRRLVDLCFSVHSFRDHWLNPISIMQYFLEFESTLSILISDGSFLTVNIPEAF